MLFYKGNIILTSIMFYKLLFFSIVRPKLILKQHLKPNNESDSCGEVVCCLSHEKDLHRHIDWSNTNARLLSWYKNGLSTSKNYSVHSYRCLVPVQPDKIILFRLQRCSVTHSISYNRQYFQTCSVVGLCTDYVAIHCFNYTLLDIDE